MSGETGIQLEHDPARIREAFARSFVSRLFPTLRKSNPKLWTADVQFVYDWQYASKFSPHDPLNLKVGDYSSTRAAEIAAVNWMHKSHQSVLLGELRKGDTTEAGRTLYTDYANPVTHHRLSITHHDLIDPLDPKTGGVHSKGHPSTWQTIVDTGKALPGAAAKDASGLGSLLSGHLVYIVVIVALILIIKK